MCVWCVCAHSVVYDSLQVHGLQPPGSYVHGIFQARILELVAISFSRRPPNPGIKPKPPAFQMDSLPLSHKESRGPVSPTHITLILYISEVLSTTANSYLLNLFTWGLYLTNKISLPTCMVIWQWQWYNNCTLRRGILHFHLFSWAPKSLWMVIATMKLKDTSSLEKKLWKT